MYKEQTQKIVQICNDIWKLTQNRLATRFPFLRGMLYSFSFQNQYERYALGTDGETVFYHPLYLVRVFQKDPYNVEYVLLHMLFHCLYLHPFLNAGISDSRWHENCDITVTSLLEKAGFSSGDSERLLHADDHAFWSGNGTEALLSRIESTWKAIGKNHGFGMSGAGGSVGTNAGEENEALTVQEIQHRRFHRYLKRFAISQEEMHLDTESFDYIPYMYGLKHYQNMPLIEHLEYQEIRRLKELVIAIDTSASCGTDTIRKFMEETYAILSDEENFFREMNIYILQCDCDVQNTAHIGCEKEWRDYLQTLVIHGRGGTDFRPVFAYVEELRRQKLLKDLKGLLYFTDGDGIYPHQPTDYETAFILLNEKETHQKIPDWASAFRLT